jgi:hypothetical protein
VLFAAFSENNPLSAGSSNHRFVKHIHAEKPVRESGSRCSIVYPENSAKEDAMKTHCLNCKYYQINDVSTGYCRVEALGPGKRSVEKPLKDADDHCAQWKDCGQTYYIRLGWIRNKENEMLR